MISGGHDGASRQDFHSVKLCDIGDSKEYSFLASLIIL